MARFFRCEHCGNLVCLVQDAGVPLVCCGQEMTGLAGNTTEASVEKHLPVLTVAGDTVHVRVGSAAHPMTAEHLIEWIYLETAQGGQRKTLTAGSPPEATFALCDGDRPIAAYAYYNLHSLWKTELE